MRSSSLVRVIRARLSRTPLLRPSAQRRVKTIVASGAVALLVGTGLAVVGVTAAEAHTPTVTPSCSSIIVDLQYYNADDSGDTTPNTVTVTIDGKVLDSVSFGSTWNKTYSIASAVPHSYKVAVVAWDDTPGADGNGPNGWSRTFTGTTSPCQPTTPTPHVAVQSNTCATAGGDVVAYEATDLTKGDSYTVAVVGTNLSSTFTADGSSHADTISGVSAGDYHLSITDNTTGQHSSCDTFNAGDCPVPIAPTITLTAQACTTAGATSSTLTVSAGGLSTTDSYTLRVTSGSATGPTVYTSTAVPAQTSLTHDIAVTPGVAYYASIADNTTKLGASTQAVPAAACPPAVAGITIAATTCTTYSGTVGLTITFSSLEPGDEYTYTVKGPTSAIDSGTYTPAAGVTTHILSEPTIAAGVTYTVTLTNTTSGQAPVTASQVTAACPIPVAPVVHLAAVPCTSTTGTPTLTVALSDLTKGDAYTVTAIAGSSTITKTGITEDAPNSGTATLTLNGLTAGVEYSVTVADAAPGGLASASTTGTATACPELGSFRVTVQDCNALPTTPAGETTVTIDSDAFVPGITYTITATVDGVAETVPPQTYMSVGAPIVVHLPAGTEPVNAVTIAVINPDGTRLVASSGDITAAPCPATPTVTAAGTPCVSGATTSTGGINAVFGDLVAGRTYQVTLTTYPAGKTSGTAATYGKSFTATSDTLRETIPVPASGSYAVGIYDTATGARAGLTSTSSSADRLAAVGATLAAGTAPRVDPTTVGAASDPIDVILCPAVAAFSIEITECTAAGGHAGIAITSDDFVDGQTYDVAITQSGSTVVTPEVYSASAGAITANATAGRAFTLRVSDARTRVALGDPISNTLSSCPLAPAVAALAITGVNAIVPGIMALVASQIGLALIGVAIIRRRGMGN